MTPPPNFKQINALLVDLQLAILPMGVAEITHLHNMLTAIMQAEVLVKEASLPKKKKKAKLTLVPKELHNGFYD